MCSIKRRRTSGDTFQVKLSLAAGFYKSTICQSFGNNRFIHFVATSFIRIWNMKNQNHYLSVYLSEYVRPSIHLQYIYVFYTHPYRYILWMIAWSFKKHSKGKTSPVDGLICDDYAAGFNPLSTIWNHQQIKLNGVKCQSHFWVDKWNKEVNVQSSLSCMGKVFKVAVCILVKSMPISGHFS